MAMTRAQLRHRAACDRYNAGKRKPPTRREMKTWLDPIRRAFAEIRTGEVDSWRGYPITRIHHADTDFARVDHAINGFVSMLDRLEIGIDTGPLKRVSKKLECGVLLELQEVDECTAILKAAESHLLKFNREKLWETAQTEMTRIEFERRGIVGAA